MKEQSKWQKLKLKTTRLSRLFSGKMEDFMGNVALAGEVMARKVSSSLRCTPYSIYDCTVDNYISIVIEGQYQNVIKRGFCSKTNQISFINDLCFNFGEAKGDLSGKIDMKDRERLFAITIEVQRLQIALLICQRDLEYSVSILKDLKLPSNFKEPNQRLTDFIKSQIKRRNSDIKIINKRLLKDNEDKEKINRQLYVDILETYESNTRITLSEFAAKIKKNRKIAEEYDKIRGNNNR